MINKNNNRLFINYVFAANMSTLHSYFDIRRSPIKIVNLCNLIAWFSVIICAQICHLLSFRISVFKSFLFLCTNLWVKCEAFQIFCCSLIHLNFWKLVICIIIMIMMIIIIISTNKIMGIISCFWDVLRQINKNHMINLSKLSKQ